MESSKVATVSLVLIVIFIGGFVLKLAKPILFPFFLAIFLSFVLSPILDFFTRLKIPKSVSILFVVLITFFILYLLGALFFASGKAFAADFPKYGQKFNSILNSLQKKLALSPLKWESVDWIRQFDLNKIGNFILSSLGPFFSFLSNLFLIFIFLIFILAGRGKTREKIQAHLSGKRAAKVTDVIQNIDGQIQKYLAIKTIVSFITGFLATLVLMFFGLDFAIVFGFLTFLLNYIPNIGSFIATSFPLVIAVFQFDSLWPAFWIFIILGSLQMILGNYVEPRLMGKGLGLSPLVVLFSLFFWGWLWGIPGMILAVPIAAIIKIICANIPELEFVAVMMSKA